MPRNTFTAGLLLPLAATLFLSACAGAAEGYPSLAIRPAERAGAVRTPPPRHIPPPPPAAALASLDSLATEARAAHTAFTAESAQATRLVGAARNAAIGSEAWARAEVARSALAAAHSRTLVPLAGMDRVYVEASTAGEDLDRIAAVHAEIEALVAGEDAVLAGLAN
ncbi:hypothetical protein PK98_08260 [Croceibacterium mercuriale]|uniref:Lipoprotein n=1 Tax=Croceibacterium mercuriale TaxID=1572751 RepID=A0A0B2C2M7_9SPHN|nr:hypothetical protein [Croceibacterium mercuriale]KHL26420.1 hypothetical protein PK98_08260 [Croceibacterium mercuriale]